MNYLDELLKSLDTVHELMKDADENKIRVSIPFMIDLLDSYQNAHLFDAANQVASYLISLGNTMIPFLNLANQETNFIHYYCNYFLPRCSDQLILAMKEECWKVIARNDLTEKTDLYLISALLARAMFNDELMMLLEHKSTEVRREMELQSHNLLIYQNYLDSVLELKKKYNM